MTTRCTNKSAPLRLRNDETLWGRAVLLRPVFPGGLVLTAPGLLNPTSCGVCRFGTKKFFSDVALVFLALVVLAWCAWRSRDDWNYPFKE